MTYEVTLDVVRGRLVWQKMLLYKTQEITMYDIRGHSVWHKRSLCVVTSLLATPSSFLKTRCRQMATARGTNMQGAVANSCTQLQLKCRWSARQRHREICPQIELSCSFSASSALASIKEFSTHFDCPSILGKTQQSGH